MRRKCRPSKAVSGLVGEACARNSPAELHFEDSRGKLSIERVRLLEFANGCLLADHPTCIVSSASIKVGSPVTVHFSLNGVRYQFGSTLEDSGRLVHLNSQRRVRRIALSEPIDISDSQRRRDLRVSVLGYDPIAVTLVDPHPDIPDACSIDAGRTTGRVVDISLGGMSVLLPRQSFRRSDSGQDFYLNFQLPDIEEEFIMLGVVRFSRPVEGSESIRIGMMFLPWRDQQGKSDRQRISQFVNAHERRSLKRRK